MPERLGGLAKTSERQRQGLGSNRVVEAQLPVGVHAEGVHVGRRDVGDENGMVAS